MKFLDWVLGRRRKADTADPQRADPQRVAEMLKTTVGGLERLPMLPAGAAQAMAAARSPDISLEELARVIERDAALAASVLRLANSALHSAGSPAQTLYQAVIRLGTRECYNAICAVAMKSLFRNVSPAQRLCFEQLWQHALLTACVCRRLDTHLALGCKGEEFTCGLTHDLGRILIALGAPEQFAAADPMDFVEGPELLEGEQAALGTDHCEVGAWFADQNRLPSSVLECVHLHHTPAEAGEYRDLVALVAAADHMANFYQREGDAASYDLSSNPHWPLLAVECGVEEARLHEVAPQALAEAVEDVGAMTTPTVTAKPATALPPARSRTEAPKPRTGAERRRAGPRYSLTLNARCHLLGKAGGPGWEATVENVSRNGLALRLGYEVQRGAVLELRFAGLGGRFARPLMVRVTNARSRSLGEWRVGCTLVKELTHSDVQVLVAAAARDDLEATDESDGDPPGRKPDDTSRPLSRTAPRPGRAQDDLSRGR
jgi:HD-like signal output (HDOD) protein